MTGGLKGYRRSGALRDGTADFLEQLTRNEAIVSLFRGADLGTLSKLFTGKLVEVEFDGSSTDRVVRHGLGREWTGAVLLRASAGSTHVVGIDSITMRSLSLDPTRDVLFRQDAATAMSAAFWIF